MRAITVKQPWAFAIATGAKNIENRSRPVQYRGPIAIHAGMAWSTRGAADSRVVHTAVAAAGGVPLGALIALAGHPSICPRGAIVALADITDCHPAAGCCQPWGDDEYDGKPVHHLVLADTRPLATPVPVKGALGLWTLPDDIATAVADQVKAVA